MKVSNVPTVPAAGEGLPPPTWEVLWDTIKPHQLSVAKALATQHGETTWEAALAVTVEGSKAVLGSASEQKRRLGTWADSPSPLYFLLVLEGKVQVLYGWRVCRALDPDGKTWVGFIGDRRISPSGVALPPKLFKAGDGGTEQYKSFGQVVTKPMSMADAQAAYTADANLSWLDTVEGVDAEKLTVWSVLPVHPKVASVFMHSPSVRAAVDILVTLYQIVPGDAQAGLEPLFEFLRVGTVDDEGSSALEQKWSRVVTSENDEMELWYAEAIGTVVPKLNETVEGMPPPSRPHPGVSTEGVQELLATLGAGAQKKEPGKRVYTTAELRRLGYLCGLAEVDDDDITVESLPRFWRGFEAVRGKLHSARAYVEAWFETEWPADAPRYRRFVSTRLLKDLIALDFDGGDSFRAWSEREGGFSLFSIYPLPDGSDPGSRRRRAVAFEDTMDNHRPGERQSMVEASGFDASIPSGRSPTWEWIMFLRTSTASLFGGNCPALPDLNEYIVYLNEGVRFRHFTGNDWRALFWKLHTALRCFFSPTHLPGYQPTQDLADFLTIVRIGLMPNRSDMPVELFEPEGVRRQETPRQETPRRRTTESGTEGGRGGGRDQPGPTNMSKRVAREWAQHLSRALRDAKAAVEGASKQWSMDGLFPNGTKEAFGGFANQVKATASGNSAPCPRLFAYGKCARRSCTESHTLLREPTHSETRAVVDWVQSRCVEIKNNPGNF